MSTILVKENELKALAFNKLTQAGLDAQTAQQVADVLVHADITGVHSHGVYSRRALLYPPERRRAQSKSNIQHRTDFAFSRYSGL